MARYQAGETVLHVKRNKIYTIRRIFDEFGRRPEYECIGQSDWDRIFCYGSSIRRVKDPLPTEKSIMKLL